MTYDLCEKLIKNGLYNTEEEKADMRVKLDIFLLANRIIDIEYTELLSILK